MMAQVYTSTYCRPVSYAVRVHLLASVLSVTLFGCAAYACAPDMLERLDPDAQEGVRRREAVPNSYRMAESTGLAFSQNDTERTLLQILRKDFALH